MAKIDLSKLSIQEMQDLAKDIEQEIVARREQDRVRIVSQMRGERVEVVTTPGAANQPGKLNGVIVGVEKQKVAAGNAQIDTEV